MKKGMTCMPIKGFCIFSVGVHISLKYQLILQNSQMSSDLANDKQLHNKQIQPLESEEKEEGICRCDIKGGHVLFYFFDPGS